MQHRWPFDAIRDSRIATRRTQTVLARSHRPAEADEGDGEEDEADAGYGGEPAPDDVEAGAAIENGLGEFDAMGPREKWRDG